MRSDDADIERILGRYRPVDPANGVRESILAEAWGHFWRLIFQGVAAVVLVGLTFFQLARGTNFDRPPSLSHDASARRIASAIEDLGLPLTRGDAGALSVQLASTVVPYAEVHGYSHVDGNAFGGVEQ